MQLSEHFTTEEFNLITGKIGDVSWQLPISAARCLCVEILEPTRAHFGKRIRITSGRRTELRNRIAGGVKQSYHLYEDGSAAADFEVMGVPPDDVFDWLRLESGLPFDSVILEFEYMGVNIAPIPNIVHAQISLNHAARRLAFYGYTNGAFHGNKYEAAEVRMPA